MGCMEENDFELVAQVRAGNADAFRGLVEKHNRTLFHTAYRICRNRQTAEDIVQESFLRAYRKIHKYDSRAGFGTWIYRITVNCALDHMRKETRRQSKAPMVEDPTMDALASVAPRPDRVAASSEIGRAVNSVLENLSPLERSAFVLRHFEGRSIQEICDAMQIHTGAAKQAIFRAVRKLRAALGPLVEENHGATS